MATDPIDQIARRLEEQKDETEDALALSFASVNPMLRYVALWSKWMSWDGQLWCRDDTLSVFDQIRSHVRSRCGDAKLLKASSIAGVERLAKADQRYAATVDQWDADDWLLNTSDGVVELKTGNLRPARADDYQTKQTAAAPQPGCPLWDKTLFQITDGNEEYVAFLQRALGYALCGSTREHALFFIYRPGGNGKGVFLNTLRHVLGTYAQVASMDTFTASNSERHPTDLAMLQGHRLVMAQETEEGKPWAEARIKSLTGGDPISARYMRQDFFTYTPKFKLFISGNHKPKLRNVDEAMRRRLHLLPFMQVFKGADKDPDLGEKLEAEASGILQWLVDGCLAYQREGLNPPPVVVEATAEYFDAEDVFSQWVADCCDVAPEYWGPPKTLLNSYNAYAKSINEPEISAKQLADRFDKEGFRAGKSSARNGRYRVGIRVRPSETSHVY